MLFAMAIYLMVFSLNAQEVFQLKEVNQLINNELSEKILNYEIAEFDSKILFDYRQRFENELSFELKTGAKKPLSFSLQAKDMRSDGYLLQVSENGQLKSIKQNKTAVFQGELVGQDYGSAIFTIDENFIMGFWQENETVYYLEPLWRLVPTAPHNQYVIYKEKDAVIPADFCGVSDETIAAKRKEQKQQPASEKLIGQCLVVEMALAADFEMFQAFGSIASVENFMFGTLASVQTNYDDEFDDELRFEVVTTLVATSNASDPWTNSNDAGTLLDDFTFWGNDGGFGGVSFDIAGIWTDRNFNGGTVGVAWLGSICTGLRYHALERFTNNAVALRVLWAHEIGHNFDADHDDSDGFIMSPFVNSSVTWSSFSQNRINAFVPSRGCLAANCDGGGGGGAPTADFSFSDPSGCAPLEVSFSDESFGSPEIWEWTFDGGDPSFSTVQNPSVTYNTPGIFDVSLFVSNDDGSNTHEEIGIITVLEFPAADFTADITGFDVDFFNLSTGGDFYDWDFGDGNFSIDETPFYTYDEPGEYDVILTVTNDCGESSFLVTVIIESTLFASFEASPTTGCAPLEVEFDDTSDGNPVSWEWFFSGGDPVTSSSSNPFVSYAEAGTYDVNFIVGNNNETETLNMEGFITVLPNPIADFSVSINDGDHTPTITNNSTNTDTYNWNFGDDQTSTDANPFHTYETAGEYTIVLTVSNSCGTDEVSHVITIIDPINPSFSISNAEGCTPHTVSFEASPQEEGLTYAWVFEGASPETATTPNPTVIYEEVGSFDVRLVITNAAGLGTEIQENAIVVNPLPQAAFTLSNTLGSGLTTFSDQSSNAATALWNFGDESTSTVLNPSHSYENEGTYTVTLTVNNECGTDTETMEITIVFVPEPSINISAPMTCVPLPVTYQAGPVVEGNTYLWSFPGGEPTTSIAINPSVVYNIPGTYDATLTVTNIAGDATMTVENIVVVNNNPEATFNVDNDSEDGMVSFFNESTNAATYLWDFGDESASTVQSPSHVYASEGTFIATLTATNECGTDITTMEVVIVFIPEPSIEISILTTCTSQAVTYQASPVGEGNTYLWSFPNGTPATSTEASPSVVYNNAGTYDASLTVTNVVGSASVTSQNIIVVNSEPQASFSTTNTLGDGLVSFSNQSINGDSWQWNFGDETLFGDENPTHNYTESGTYTVKLTATNECGSHEFTTDVTILFAPVASIATSIIEGCVPLQVDFQAIPLDEGNTYEWSFSGGSPSLSNNANESVLFGEAGNHTAILTVTNAAGSSTVTQVVTIFPMPTADFTVEVNGLTASFTNTSDNAITYSWNIAGTNINEEHPSFTFPDVGTYDVILTAENDCGTDDFLATITIEGQIPEISFTVGNNEGCGLLEASFTSEIQNADEFVWTFLGGNPATSNDINPSVTYNEPGVYTVTLTATNAFGTNAFSLQDIVIVNEETVAEFNFFLDGATAQFQNNSIAANNVIWLFSNGSTNVTEMPSFTFPGNGVYEVILTAEGLCNTDTTTQTITVDGNLPVIEIVTDKEVGCLPFTVSFTDVSTEEPTSRQWAFTGGDPVTSNDQNVVVTYSAVGSYDVSLIVANEFGSTQQNWENLISVIDVPEIPDFTINTLDDMSGELVVLSPNATYNYTWNLGNGETATGENAAYSYDEEGIYTITLTAMNECGETSATQELMVIINSINTPVWARKIALFPNPSQGLVKLEAQGWTASGEMGLNLLNVLGQKIEQQQLQALNGQWSYSFDWRHLPAGTYMLQLNWGAEIWSQKMIKL